jgi:hypothetical protein
MTDGNFEHYMRRLAVDPVTATEGTEGAERTPPAEPSAAPVPDAGAIWWRAQLRHRMAERQRVTRPLRVAERAAGVMCFGAAVAAAVTLGARLGVAGVAPFLVVTLIAGAGAAALVLRGAAE